MLLVYLYCLGACPSTMDAVSATIVDGGQAICKITQVSEELN
jgi:hypothetical protein